MKTIFSTLIAITLLTIQTCSQSPVTLTATWSPSPTQGVTYNFYLDQNSPVHVNGCCTQDFTLQVTGTHTIKITAVETVISSPDTPIDNSVINESAPLVGTVVWNGGTIPVTATGLHISKK